MRISFANKTNTEKQLANFQHWISSMVDKTPDIKTLTVLLGVAVIIPSYSRGVLIWLCKGINDKLFELFAYQLESLHRALENTDTGKKILELPNLYGPIISSVIPTVFNLGLTQINFFWDSYRRMQQLEMSGLERFEKQAKELYENDNFFEAAKAFRQAALCLKKHSGYLKYSVLSEKLIELNFFEAKSLFRIGKYTDEKQIYALEILNNVLEIEPKHKEALNLRGIINFLKEKSELAKNDFSISLKLDSTQSDIFTYWAYLNKSYDLAIQFSEFNIANMYMNGVAHILLECRANALNELFKTETNHDQKLQLLGSAIESLLGAIELIPNNPFFSAKKSELCEKCSELYKELSKIIGEEPIKIHKIAASIFSKDEAEKYEDIDKTKSESHYDEYKKQSITLKKLHQTMFDSIKPNTNSIPLEADNRILNKCTII